MDVDINSAVSIAMCLIAGAAAFMWLDHADRVWQAAVFWGVVIVLLVIGYLL